MADVNNNSNIGNFIIVKVANDPVINGNNLLEAYRNAKNTKPNNQVLDENNRLSIIIPPGNYDLGTQSLVLDTNFIDIIGSTTDRNNHYIYSNVFLQSRGVIKQTINNVKIKNLRVKNTNNTFVVGGLVTDPAVYLPASTTVGTNGTEIENVFFECIEGNSYSTAITAPTSYFQYDGKYTKVTTGSRSFDYISNHAILTDCDSIGNYSYGSSTYGIDGILIRCKGQNYSFGYGSHGACFGTLRDCIGYDYSFLTNGSFYGNLTNCIAYGSHSFCSADSNAVGDLEYGGLLSNCEGHGQYNFCANTNANANDHRNAGWIMDCKSYGGYSFSYNFITDEAQFIDCSVSPGSDFCFGARGAFFTAKSISGTFVNCTAMGASCFGFLNLIFATFINCSALINSFIANTRSDNKGIYINCSAGGSSFDV